MGDENLSFWDTSVTDLQAEYAPGGYSPWDHDEDEQVSDGYGYVDPEEDSEDTSDG